MGSKYGFVTLHQTTEQKRKFNKIEPKFKLANDNSSSEIMILRKPKTCAKARIKARVNKAALNSSKPETHGSFRAKWLNREWDESHVRRA